MQDYLLFIDTETSGLPKNWNLPYTEDANWPHAIQVSWVIYTNSCQEVKRDNHYISDDDFTISKGAFKTHGITREFLKQNGESRKNVMQFLYNDLEKYKPLVVGHFMELDYHMTGAAFHRLGMEQPISNLPMYCTMLGSKYLVRNPQRQYLKLGKLYELLFDKPLLKQHNAMTDALATAECFFELRRMGAVDDDKIAKQQSDREKIQRPVLKEGCGVTVLLLLIVMGLLIYWL